MLVMMTKRYSSWVRMSMINLTKLERMQPYMDSDDMTRDIS